MEDLLKEVINKLINHESVILVGPTDSGKTHWIENVLIPHLKLLGKTPQYLKDGDALPEVGSDIVICDEVETLFDEACLKDKSLKKYYNEEYLEKVRKWYENYAQLPKSTMYVITRNAQKQINNLVKNFHNADWDNRPISVIEFKN
jgi:hypothetical protein